MNWLILNLPFMLFATALTLAVTAAGLYLDSRKEEAKMSSMSRHPSAVTQEQAHKGEKVG